jgi:hypothetical protein
VTSTPATPGIGDGRSLPAPLRGRASGLLTFAAILMATFGLFNVFQGIVAIFKSHVFTDDTYYVVGSVRAWGWVLLLFGILQMVAAAAVADGRSWGRWFGIVVIALNVLGQMVLLPSYPFWSLAVVAADVVALYALSVYGGGRLPDEVRADDGTWTRTPGEVPRPPA